MIIFIIIIVLFFICVMGSNTEEDINSTYKPENKNNYKSQKSINKIAINEKTTNENATDKVYALIYKTDKISTENIYDNKTEEYYLVYNSTGKVSEKYSKYELMRVQEVSMGKYTQYEVYGGQITKCIIEDKIIPKNMFGYFENLSDCSEIIGLNNIDTHKIKNMSFLFCNCRSLTQLDLSNFNTSNVTDMKYMFFACFNLVSLNLSNFDTSNVRDFTGMFEGCSKLKYEDISAFKKKKLNDIKNKNNSSKIDNKTQKTYVPITQWSDIEAYNVDFDYDYETYEINVNHNKILRGTAAATEILENAEDMENRVIEEERQDSNDLVCERCGKLLYDNNSGNLHLVDTYYNFDDLVGVITCPHCGTQYRNYCTRCRKYENNLHCGYCGQETILKTYGGRTSASELLEDYYDEEQYDYFNDFS